MKRRHGVSACLADIRMPFPGAAAVLAVVVIMGARYSSALSEPVLVNTSQSQNRRWETVFTNEVPLRWDWNAGATDARLEITGMNATFSTNFTVVTSNYLWRASTPGTPSAEDVYDVTLTFYADRDITVVGALTSRLAVVEGALGGTVVNAADNAGAAWNRVRENAVIPYDIGWSGTAVDAARGQLVIAKDSGAAQTNAVTASGYYGWKIKGSAWGYGTFNLALTFPGAVTNEWDAELIRALEGLMFSVR